MLKSSEITDVISKPMTGIVRGKVMQMANREQRITSNSTARQRQYLKALLDMPPSNSATYNHPAEGKLPTRPENEPLSPSEISWLQLLPADPTKVTYNDAQTLAAMSQSLPPIKNSADRRLVDSIWLPVKEVHDLKAATTDLANAEHPIPYMPDPLAAMADAVASENPHLEPEEAIARASRAIVDAKTIRITNRSRAITQAQDKVADLKNLAARRTAVTV
jgi:hypothetical protein